jgi:rSAM/selenodomain-associated transferase 2
VQRVPTASPIRRAGLSIVVPVLDEAEGIEATLAGLEPMRRRGAEVIVVDGGSRDATFALAVRCGAVVRATRRGRARQMNAGAAAARGDVLLFLHADTRLPENTDALVFASLADGRHVWGRFDVAIEGRHAALRMIAAAMNARSRLTGIATGDQAIFVTSAAFRAAGGFPDIPLMEDIVLSRLLKRQSRPACLWARAVTSGRRWDTHGVVRTMLTMWRLRLAFFLGADPRWLARRYGYAPD